MSRFAFGLCLALAFAAPSFAQSSGTPADHDALWKIKADAVAAVNARDYATLRKVINEPFMATVLTQESFSNFDQLKSYFESLFTRDALRVKTISLAAEADDYSQIFEGRFALTKGSTKEHYDMADGRAFDMNGRWTAVSIQKDGAWKLLAIHTGTNFLDNPVLGAIERSVVWLGLAGAGLGLLIGFGAAWIIRRPRTTA
jgi:ketosteroid isomerase-like protein